MLFSFSMMGVKVLLIPTFLATSKIPEAGLGIFCSQPVKAGTLIWEFTRGFDYVVRELPENLIHRRFVEKYGYVPLPDPTHWVMCADDARFINHSDDPTCLDIGEFTTARHDLAAGTELTSDYRSFCKNPFTGFEPMRAR